MKQHRTHALVASLVCTCALGLALPLSACNNSNQPQNSASSQAQAAATTPVKDGTFKGTAQGRNGEIVAEVTFKDNKITGINTTHMESLNIGDAAIKMLTDDIIASQSLGVDDVTGASISSFSFKDAVVKAVNEAGGKAAEWEKRPVDLPQAEPVTESCDVLVIGSGGAGMAAATAASEKGASVIIAEKMDIYGGNTNAGEGTYNVPDPKRQDPMHIEDSNELFYQQTYEGGDEKGDPKLIHYLADNALNAFHWIEGLGLKFNDEVFTAIGGKWQRGHSVAVEVEGQQGGAYYVNTLKKAAEKNGAKLITDAKIEKLTVDGSGKVTGATGTRPSDGAPVHISAKSVVLATGGYGQNAELAMQYDKRVTPKMPSSNVASSTGDGIKLGQDVGADLMNMELVQIHPLGDPQNGGVATFVGNWLGVEDYVFVNKEAKRFINEDGRRDEISNAELKQTDGTMWLLVDSTDIGPDRQAQIDDLVAKKHTFRADTIEDLAKQIGLDPAALKATIDEYNADIEAGNPDKQGKKLFFKKADGSVDKEASYIKDGPFYASQRVPTIHYTMGGLKINDLAQVINTKGQVIPNLYAAGECTGGVQGANRLGGNSFPDIITFGRQAGTQSAANAGK